jgi:hypothetical protein
MQDGKINRDSNDTENGDDTITRSFVPSILSSNHKEDAINKTLTRLQSERASYALWPHRE